jgi:hypothetical protein
MGRQKNNFKKFFFPLKVGDFFFKKIISKIFFFPWLAIFFSLESWRFFFQKNKNWEYIVTE